MNAHPAAIVAAIIIGLVACAAAFLRLRYVRTTDRETRTNPAATVAVIVVVAVACVAVVLDGTDIVGNLGFVLGIVLFAQVLSLIKWIK